MNKASTTYRILQELAKGMCRSSDLAIRLGIPQRSVASRLYELGEFGLTDHGHVITEDGKKALEQMTLTPK